MTEESKIEEQSWKDRHDIIKIIKFASKDHGWIHLVLAKRKDNGDLVLRLKKFRNWFSIPSKKQLAIIRRLLEKGSEELGWHEELSDAEINKLVGKHKELKSSKVKDKKKIKHQKEVIDELLNQITSLREEKFLIYLDEFKKDIKKLTHLLKSGSNEKEIQEWLFEHPWIFGPTYLEVSKEELNRSGDRIDFLLQRYDTFYDIIELKLPSCKLFLGESENDGQKDISREYRMSAEVKDAISQVIGYLETYEIDKTNILWEKGKSIHKPKGVIVIGRLKNNKRALKSLNSYLRDVEILTYDDVLEIGKNFIKLIENRNKSKNIKRRKNI